VGGGGLTPLPLPPAPPPFFFLSLFSSPPSFFPLIFNGAHGGRGARAPSVLGFTMNLVTTFLHANIYDFSIGKSEVLILVTRVVIFSCTVGHMYFIPQFVRALAKKYNAFDNNVWNILYFLFS
jgi:hypothetical protein